MGNFIKSIEIQSFRGIRSLRMEDLAQINILTGDNNCGKTSVLEVLESLEAPDSFRVWRSLLSRRGIDEARTLSFYEGLYDLFDVNAEEKRLEYTIVTEEETMQVCMEAEEKEEELTKKEYDKLQGISAVYFDEEGNEDQNMVEAIVNVPKLEITAYINGEKCGGWSVFEKQRRFRLDLRKKRNNVVYISPTRHAEGRAYLSEVLDQAELYEEMLMILREFDEDIISINYDHDNRTLGGGVYKILSKNSKRALPLNVYGDGMKKAVLLMSAVVKARDGILLLDEFETAIHTSAMNKIFKWILETCVKLNVQVFMTSHSREAIDKVLKCAPQLQGRMALYTLYRDKDGAYARRLTARKAIEVQDDMGLELR